MTSWIESLKDYLVAQQAYTFRTDLFIGGMDDTDTNASLSVLALAEYGGTTTNTMADGGTENPRLQLAMRGPDYMDTRAKLITARSLICHIRNQTVNGTPFVAIDNNNQTINYLGTDAQGRFLWSANVTVIVGSAT